jgi:hypothetical protein
MTEQQKAENRILSRGTIIVENFFGRWKTLFGGCHETYRGDIKQLSKIVRVTTAITHWCIRHHPLRRPNEEMIDESKDERRGPAIELDEASSDSN